MISTLASQEGRWFMQNAAGVSPSYSLTKRWGCYAEFFADMPSSTSGSSGRFAGSGITYLAGKELQLDLNVGRRLNGDETSYFLGAGLAKLW